MTMPNWAEHLKLRDEVVDTDGSVNDLQISLGKVVYQTEDVPYRNLDYWCEITEPTDSLIGVFSRVARRLWSTHGESTALIQFDQGMGGGKSHALVGLWHMARRPKEFMSSPIGTQVRELAETGGRSLSLSDVHVVTLCADRFSPGKPSELYGPAENLFERFLWSLFPNNRASYDRFRSQGPNKQTIADALRSVDKPVLILLDELMDYISAATSKDYVERLPDEQSFLNSLFDACDDVPNVVFLLVMIRSEFDQAGYSPQAQDLREFIQSRVERNGTSVRVTESKDFMNIIRKRIFTETPTPELVSEAAAAFTDDVENTLWQEKVFDQLPGGRTTATTAEQLHASYPFHPDLVSLVQTEWSTTVGFQRVRSTVRIFSATVLHWANQHQAGEWVPSIIGVGDLPLGARGVLDSILNSGLLLNNETEIRGFANLASTDVASIDWKDGRAVAIDRALTEAGVDAAQPSPAVRMATALFNLSLVSRSQSARGATKAEMLAAIWNPGLDFQVAEEVFGKVTDPDEGLGSLESTDPDNNRNRYWLSTKRTLRAIQKAAKAQVANETAQQVAWQEAKKIAASHTGPFDKVIPIDRLGEDRRLDNIIEEVVDQSTRLIILDPREWSLGNGNHAKTRTLIEELLGLGKRTVTYYASTVIAAANSANRRFMFERAKDVVAWRSVIAQLGQADDKTQAEARSKLAEAESQLRDKVMLAYRHFVFASASKNGHSADYRKLEEEARTTLRGDHVWRELVEAGRAVERGGLAPGTLEAFLDRYDRSLTPKEVVESFYSNPRQVLVGDVGDITDAWDALVGVGPDATGGWALVGKDDQAFGFTERGQIAPSRTDARFKRVVEETESPDLPDSQPAGDMVDTEAKSSTETVGDSGVAEFTYREYRISIPMKSLGNRDVQSDFSLLLSKISEHLDPIYRDEYGNQQVVSLDIVWQRPESSADEVVELVEKLGGRVDVEDPLI